MKGDQRNREEGLKVKNAVGSKRYFCAGLVVIVWTCLKALGRGPELEGQCRGRRVEPAVFSKAVALTTIDSALATVMRRDCRSLLLWFPEIASSPRRTPSLPLLFLMDCWGLGQEEQGSGIHPAPLGAELAV